MSLPTFSPLRLLTRWHGCCSVFGLMLLAASCATDSDPSGGGAHWQLVHSELDAALISVAGSAPDDVWTVGADSGDGQGALVLHYDGETWTRVPAGTDEHLWWVHVFGPDALMVGGTGGTVLRYADGAFEPLETPGNATVYGIWGAREDDVWVVGGDPEVTPGFVWRFDGTGFRDVTAELPSEAQGPVIFKVWGQSSDDVWLVGADGFALHWDGSRFSLGDTGTRQRLFTVNGVPGGEPGFVAVGGYGRATILEHDGTGWHDRTPETSVDEPAIAQLFGVAMRGPEEGYAVGYDGTVLRRDASGWSRVTLGVEVFQPFHAVWIDPEGGVWAVGGDVLTPALDDGMLVHLGEEIANEIDP